MIAEPDQENTFLINGGDSFMDLLIVEVSIDGVEFRALAHKYTATVPTVYRNAARCTLHAAELLQRQARVAQAIALCPTDRRRWTEGRRSSWRMMPGSPAEARHTAPCPRRGVPGTASVPG
jgi:hypothetical protein